MPTYDNASIERMLARNELGGGKQGLQWLEQERERGRAADAARIAAGPRQSQGTSFNPNDAPAMGVSRTTGDTRRAEEERQKMMRRLDSEMFRMRAGSGLNSRSKRQLYGQMMNQMQGLTSENFQMQNQRDMKGADQANDAAKTNAGLRDAAFNRKQRQQQWGAQFDESNRRFDLGRQDQREAAAAQNQASTLKTLMEMQKYQDERAGAQQDRDWKNLNNAEDMYARRLQLAKDRGLTGAAAEAAAAGDMASHFDAGDSVSGTVAEDRLREAIATQVNAADPDIFQRMVTPATGKKSRPRLDAFDGGFDLQDINEVGMNLWERFNHPGKRRVQFQGANGDNNVYLDADVVEQYMNSRGRLRRAQ